MNLFKFITSKSFIINIALAIIVVVGLVFASLKWLESYTNHDQKIKVPIIAKLNVDDAKKVLQSHNLDLVVLDTLSYNKEIPPLTIVEQNPAAGAGVKENRKIYVKINAAGYSSITLPALEQLTFRQALSTIESLGLRVGEKSYRTYIGKDVVLSVTQKGKILSAGDKVLKDSKIDFVLGDGKARLSEEELDVAPEIEYN